MFMPPPRPPFGLPFGPSFVPNGPPLAPPPSQIPKTAPYKIDPGSIRRCKHKYTYIWLKNGDNFWFYPVYIGKKSISGYRWIGFWWIYYGTDLKKIESFVCV